LDDFADVETVAWLDDFVDPPQPPTASTVTMSASFV
jgi:hypothetical protein